MFIVEMGNNFHQGNIHSLNHWKETNFSIYTNSVIYSDSRVPDRYDSFT